MRTRLLLAPALVFPGLLACSTDHTSDKDLGAYVPDTTEDPGGTTPAPDDTGDTGDTGEPPDPTLTDTDGDGFYAEENDCDDTDPTVHPGAEDDPWTDRDCVWGIHRDHLSTTITGGPGSAFLGLHTRALPDLDGDGAAELFTTHVGTDDVNTALVFSGRDLVEGAHLTPANAIGSAALSGWWSRHRVGGDPMGWGGPALMSAYPSGSTDENALILADLTSIIEGGTLDLDTLPMVSANTLPPDSNHASNALSNIDLDGDGIDDLVISADIYPDAADNWNGRVFVHYGAGLRTSPRREAEDADAIIEGLTDSAFGRGLAAWNDIDGDGLDDLGVGAPYWEHTEEGGYHAGVAFVFTGDTLSRGGTFSAADARTSIQLPDGPAGSSQVGDTLAKWGDITGDGQAELAVSGTWGGSIGSGIVWLFDPTDLPEGTVSTDDAYHAIDGPGSIYELGSWVSGGFDFNEDGLSDGFVSHRSHGGVHHLLSGADLAPGGHTLLGTDPNLATWSSSTPEAGITHAEGDAADFDGDSQPELVLAAGSDATEAGATGVLYIVHDRP